MPLYSKLTHHFAANKLQQIHARSGNKSPAKKNTEELLQEVEKLEQLEKESVLAYVRAFNFKRKKSIPIANPDVYSAKLTHPL